MAGPPISLDDLKTLIEATSVSPKAVRRDPTIAAKISETVMLGIDGSRFPWLEARRTATAHERRAAILASAALLACRRVETDRRTEGKEAQERRVRECLLEHGFQEVPRREVRTHAEAPQPGQFCLESKLAGRKADLIVGLWDRRIMPIECKVSNSALNSIKRLNNDAAAKAEAWRSDLGTRLVVPTAVLSGVYKLESLIDAQERGLMLFWAHRLGDLVGWIDTTSGG